MDAKELDKLAKELAKKMRQAAAELNFEEAASTARPYEGGKADAPGAGGLRRKRSEGCKFILTTNPGKATISAESKQIREEQDGNHETV